MPGARHLGALPVLLEPAARVAVDGQVDDLQALDAGLGGVGEVTSRMRCLPCLPIEEVQVAGSPCSLPLRAVAGLGGLLGRAPPGLVGRRTSRWWP